MEKLKLKLNEIKTYKSLYEYIGYDSGKDKSELQLIVEGYERSKLRRYIRDPNEQLRRPLRFPRVNLGFVGRGRRIRGITRGRGRGRVLFG